MRSRTPGKDPNREKNGFDEKALRRFFAQVGLPRPDRDLHLDVHKLPQGPPPVAPKPFIIPRQWIYVSASVAALLILLFVIPPFVTRVLYSSSSGASASSSPRIMHGSSHTQDNPAVKIVDHYLATKNERPGPVLWVRPLSSSRVNQTLGTAFSVSSSFVQLRMQGPLANNQGIRFPALTFWVDITNPQVVSTTYGKTSREEATQIALQWAQLHGRHVLVIHPRILSVTKMSRDHVIRLTGWQKALPVWLWVVKYQPHPQTSSTGHLYIDPFTGRVVIWGQA